MVKNPPARQETLVQSLGWEDPLEEGMATRSNILAWNPHGQRSLRIQSMGSQRINMTEQLSTAQHSKYFTCLNLRNPESPRGQVLVHLCQRENQAEELRVLPAQD